MTTSFIRQTVSIDEVDAIPRFQSVNQKAKSSIFSSSIKDMSYGKNALSEGIKDELSVRDDSL
jgi:hypothetical protein